MLQDLAFEDLLDAGQDLRLDLAYTDFYRDQRGDVNAALPSPLDTDTLFNNLAKSLLQQSGDLGGEQHAADPGVQQLAYQIVQGARYRYWRLLPAFSLRGLEFAHCGRSVTRGGSARCLLSMADKSHAIHFWSSSARSIATCWLPSADRPILMQSCKAPGPDRRLPLWVPMAQASLTSLPVRSPSPLLSR